MQEAVLILFSRIFRKYVIYPIDLVREVLRLPRFRSIRQYVILSTTHRLPTHYLLCYDCTKEVRYLWCQQNLIIICLFDRVTARYHFFTLPYCQTYRYLCIMH
jgi:hypothetical protein